MLTGVPVSFKILSDTTGGASLANSSKSVTSTTGEAFNTLNVKGEGQVVVVANLLHHLSGEVLVSSNQVIATTAGELPVTITLTFDDSSQLFEAAVPFSEGLVATVTDQSLGALLLGDVRVRFNILSDTSGSAGLTSTFITNTNTQGEAFNTINLSAVGQVVITADVVSSSGKVKATLNQIVASGQ